MSLARPLHLIASLLGLACCASGAPVAEPGRVEQGMFGAALLAVGDHDGDGLAELLVAAPRDGRLWLLAGGDLRALRRWDVPVSNGFGARLERVAGAGPGRDLALLRCSGRDDHWLALVDPRADAPPTVWSADALGLGRLRAATDAGDRNGDGVGDLLVCVGVAESAEVVAPAGSSAAKGPESAEPSAAPAPGGESAEPPAPALAELRLVSGADGTTLSRHPLALDSAACELVGLPRADALPELLLAWRVAGEPRADGALELARVALGADGEPAGLVPRDARLQDLPANRGAPRLGVVRDRDGDGRADLLVAQPQSGVGSVCLLSGADLRLLRRIEPPEGWSGDGWGRRVLDPGDADGDGRPDLLVSAPSFLCGVAFVSGDAKRASVLWPEAFEDYGFGAGLAALAPADGELPPVLVGITRAGSPSMAGEVERRGAGEPLRRGQPADVEPAAGR